MHQVLERGRIECQDFVVVIGPGPIGILAAFAAKSAGASKVAVVGMTSGEYIEFEVAKKLGADFIINAERKM